MASRCVVLALLLCTTAAQARAECGPMPPTCSLLRTAPIIFVGTLESEKDLGYHFRIEEPIKGVSTETIDVINIVFEGFSGFAGYGERYLVFAEPFKLNDETLTVLRDCSRNMVPLKYAQPLLQQLRREREGRRMSSIYGSLLTDPGDPPEGGRLLPGIALTFQSDRTTFNVTTDAQGSYALDQVPPGSYRVFADLPPEFELGQYILNEPPPPVEIGRGMCLEQPIVAVPAGRISGIVFGPDGVPRMNTTVRLFKADQYTEGVQAPYAFQTGDKPFTFPRLLSGDYLVVFDANQDASEYHPFPTTFYPNASTVKEAKVIHVAPGQQVLNADIHLPEPVATRPVRVVLDWNGRDRNQYYTPDIHPASPKHFFSPKPGAEDTFEITLLTNTTYRIQASAMCRYKQATFARTEYVTVDGANPQQQDVTLTFTGGDCTNDVRK